MSENEKPLSDTRFWTIDMIVLAVINLLFIALILYGLYILAAELAPPLSSWLKQKFGV